MAIRTITWNKWTILRTTSFKYECAFGVKCTLKVFAAAVERKSVSIYLYTIPFQNITMKDLDGT